MKTLALLKCQRFGDKRNDETKPRKSKRQRLDEHDDEEGNGLDNKKGNSLDKDEGEIESSRFSPSFLFLFLFFPERCQTAH